MNAPANAPDPLGPLIDELRAAVDSPANRQRQQRRPRAVFATEDPICWCRVFAMDARRYFTDAAYYCEMTLRAKLWRWRNFPLDQAPLTAELPAWLGHYPEYTFVGLDVQFSPGGIPHIQQDHPLTRTADLGLLAPVDFASSGWMPRLLRWYDEIDRLIAGRLPVPLYEPTGIWWRGGLDLAIQLRGYENFVTDTVERPAFLHDLMQWLTDQRCRWYEACDRHFGRPRRPVCIGDDWVNVPFITPGMFADFVLPYYLQIEAFHGGITAIHSCGNQVPVQHLLREIKSLVAMEISPWSDRDESLANIPPGKLLCPSLHPNEVLCATADPMRARLEGYVAALAGRRYEQIGTSGLTPLSDDISAFVQQVRTWTEIADAVMPAAHAQAPV